MENEVWKRALGFDGYEVSSLGKVRSVDRMVDYPTYKRSMKGCELHLRKDSKGRYLLVSLHKGKQKCTVLVHRLVYESFCGSLNGREVNHINGICDDNRLENLEAVTRSENEKHKYDVLGYKGSFHDRCGALHPMAKSVVQIDIHTGNAIRTYGSVREAERETGVCSSCITLCCNGKQKKSGGYYWRYQKDFSN